MESSLSTEHKRENAPPLLLHPFFSRLLIVRSWCRSASLCRCDVFNPVVRNRHGVVVVAAVETRFAGNNHDRSWTKETQKRSWSGVAPHIQGQEEKWSGRRRGGRTQSPQRKAHILRSSRAASISHPPAVVERCRASSRTRAWRMPPLERASDTLEHA